MGHGFFQEAVVLKNRLQAGIYLKSTYRSLKWPGFGGD
jgi:hypothetical protein